MALADLTEAAQRDDANRFHGVSLGRCGQTGGWKQLQVLQAAADPLALLLGRLHERQLMSPTSCPSRFSAHLIAIGLVTTLRIS